jgi:hypothetical protein
MGAGRDTDLPLFDHPNVRILAYGALVASEHGTRPGNASQSKLWRAHEKRWDCGQVDKCTEALDNTVVTAAYLEPEYE